VDDEGREVSFPTQRQRRGDRSVYDEFFESHAEHDRLDVSLDRRGPMTWWMRRRLLAAAARHGFVVERRSRRSILLVRRDR
jgi:hypothetical protein